MSNERSVQVYCRSGCVKFQDLCGLLTLGSDNALCKDPYRLANGHLSPLCQADWTDEPRSSGNELGLIFNYNDIDSLGNIKKFSQLKM